MTKNNEEIIIDKDKFEKAENEPIDQEAVNKFIEDTDKFYPKNSKIMYDYNAKDCEQCSPDSVCCYCKNIACYKLEEQLKQKEQECDELKDKLNCRFCYPIMKIDDPENFKLCQETDCFRRQLDQLKKEKEKLECEISHYEHDLGWCSSLINVYEEKIMKCFYALHQIQLHNLKIKDKDIHLILKEVKEDLKEYNKMKNEELDKKVKDEKGV